MKAIAEIIVTFLDLVEAEARAFRVSVVRLGLGLACVLAAAVMLLGGLGLIVWAGYLYLVPVVNPPTAALIEGLIALILMAGLIWSARRLAR